MALLARCRVVEHLLVAAADGNLAALVGPVEDDQEVADTGRVVVFAVMVSDGPGDRGFSALTCGSLATSSPSPTDEGFAAEW